MSLVTPAEVFAFIRGLTSSEDYEIDDLIQDADSYLAAWLGWPVPDTGVAPTLVSATYTEYHREPSMRSARVLDLRIPAVTSVTSVHVDANGDYAGLELEVTSAMRAVRGNRIHLLTTSTVAFVQDEEDGNRVVYVAGFDGDPDDTPRHVKTAMFLCIRELWTLKTIAGVPNGVETRKTDAVITPEIRTLLGRYRLMGTANG